MTAGQDRKLLTLALLPDLTCGISIVPLEMMPSTIFSLCFLLSLPIFSPMNKCAKRRGSRGLAGAELLQHPQKDPQGSSSSHLQQHCHLCIEQQAAHPTSPHVLSVFCFQLHIVSLVPCPEYYKAAVCILWFYQDSKYPRWVMHRWTVKGKATAVILEGKLLSFQPNRQS